MKKEERQIRTVTVQDWIETMVYRNMESMGQLDIIDEYEDVTGIHLQIMY